MPVFISTEVLRCIHTYWIGMERETGLLNDHGQKGLWSSNYGLSFLNGTVDRPFLIHQYHKLLVDQAGESSLILFYPSLPIPTVTILFIVQTRIMLRIKEALTVQGTKIIERNHFCPKWIGNVWLLYP